jgi:tryptophan synthase beta chain
MAPLVCALYDQQLIEAVAVPQNPIFEAALQFARTEGIIPAPEPSHAIRVVIDEAIRCRERGERKTIAFVLCGHGHFDLASYERYLTGQLEDFALPQSAIDEALSLVPKVEPRA